MLFRSSLRVQKAFTLPNERGVLKFSTEFFNLFNAPNVEIGAAQQVYGNSLDVPTANANFGRVKDSITGNYLTSGTLRTTPFQVQLGLRFEF